MLCLDLDRFKSVNDTLGHQFGDKLLRQVAERIRGCLREGDTLARLGGDEFAILQGSIDQTTETNALAARLNEVIGAPFDLDGHQVVIGVSIGIAVAPADAADPDQLLKNADMALYRAKTDGRGIYRFFEVEMDALMQQAGAHWNSICARLWPAVSSNFTSSLSSIWKKDDICFEALLRWNLPRAVGAAARIYPAGGRNGIDRTDRRVGFAPGRPGGCQVAEPDQDRGQCFLGSIHHAILPWSVTAALAPVWFGRERLEVEITELVLLSNTESTLATLHQLRALGVRISMDDFGTGYSSLSYLRSFPFDKIKIDRSFVQDLSDGAEPLAIVHAVAGLAKGLKMTSTAEGVETREQLEVVKSIGCTEMQGYLFSRPARPARSGSFSLEGVCEETRRSLTLNGSRERAALTCGPFLWARQSRTRAT